MPTVTLRPGETYTQNLQRRLDEYGISYGALSRESGIDMSQISRWMNHQMQPQLRNIVRLEAALTAIRRSMPRPRRKKSA